MTTAVRPLGGENGPRRLLQTPLLTGGKHGDSWQGRPRRGGHQGNAEEHARRGWRRCWTLGVVPAKPPLDAHGRPLVGAFLRASQQRRQIELGPSFGGKRLPPPSPPVPKPGVNWTPLGPSVIKNAAALIECGRVAAIAVGPGGSRIYAGAADGGVWISIDTGSTWTPLDDFFTAQGSVPGASSPSD
jgi:hypothetical protein